MEVLQLLIQYLLADFAKFPEAAQLRCSMNYERDKAENHWQSKYSSSPILRLCLQTFDEHGQSNIQYY